MIEILRDLDKKYTILQDGQKSATGAKITGNKKC